MIKKYGLSKAQRVCGRDDVNILFKEGKGFFSFPFKCVYIIKKIDTSKTEENTEGDISNRDIRNENLRMMISVGKKYHKRAVRRNRVKRLGREAFRLNKHLLLDKMTIDCETQIDICYIYVSSKEEDFKTVENGIKKSFDRLAEML